MSIKINTIIYHNIFYTYTDIAFLVIADSRSRTILTAGYINIWLSTLCPKVYNCYQSPVAKQRRNKRNLPETTLKPRWRTDPLPRLHQTKIVAVCHNYHSYIPPSGLISTPRHNLNGGCIP